MQIRSKRYFAGLVGDLVPKRQVGSTEVKDLLHLSPPFPLLTRVKGLLTRRANLPPVNHMLVGQHSGGVGFEMLHSEISDKISGQTAAWSFLYSTTLSEWSQTTMPMRCFSSCISSSSSCALGLNRAKLFFWCDPLRALSHNSNLDQIVGLCTPSQSLDDAASML